MQKMDIRLIILDFDGTLGDTRQNIVLTMQMTLREMGLPVRSEAECASTIGLPLAKCFEVLFPEIGESGAERCAETYRRIFEVNKKKLVPGLFPKVRETLEMLYAKGFTLSVASSRTSKSLFEFLDEMGLSGMISFVVGADEVVNAKPHAEPVIKILDALHFSADKALVVGDMAVDILMGVNAGARTCGVTWGNGSEEELRKAGADYIIHSMDELLKIV